MASRRDQLQSYQFLVQRVLSAFVMRETDPPQSPLRRGVGAAFAGAMIAIIMAAGFAVFGLVTKIGSGKWRVEGAVVVEKETGAPFVYRQGLLHPMANYTSALLASGQVPPPTFRESNKTLSRARRGVMLGIPNAPGSLPDRGKMVRGPWTLCAVPGTDVAGKATTSTSLILGTAVGGRRLGEDEGLLAHNGAGVTYLLWHSHRHEIRGSNTVVSLFGAQTSPMMVAPAWLNGLPVGAPIAPITLADAGQPSVLPGRRVGDLVVAQTAAGPQFYLVMSDGLTPITELQKAAYAGQTGASEQSISLSEANNAKKSGKLLAASGDDAPPGRPPRLVPTSNASAGCAEFTDARTPPAVSVLTGASELTSGIPTVGNLPTGTTLANRIAVPPGRVVLVRALSSPTATAGAYNLVTDLGLRYPIPSDEALLALGYPPQRAVDMPSGLVNRIPPGPTLDPEAAKLPVDQQVRQPAR
jgi:type VII secretion protein EccB